MLLNAALNMVDDAVFTMMDMANGMDPMAAMEGLGKKALVSVASSAASGVANGFGSVKSAAGGVAASGTATTSNTFMDSGLKGVLGLKDSVIGSTLLKGTELMATNVSTSAINAVSFKGLFTGGDAFDEKAFKQGAFGKSAMTSVAAGMAGTAVTTGMGKWNIGTNERKVDAFNKYQVADMRGMNNFVGSLASTGVTYAMTGNAKFNVLNASMLGSYGKNKVLRTGGMLELNFGDDGFSAGIGMGGTDISRGTVMTAVRGAQHWGVNTGIERAAKRDGLDVATALREQYGFGDAAAQKQLRDIIAGKTILKDRGNTASDAETENKNGQRVVYLDNYNKAGMSLSDQFRLGITLQHEAHRDGIVNDKNVQETRDAVLAHMSMANNVAGDEKYGGLMQDIIKGDANLNKDFENLYTAKDLAAFNSYVDSTYDSSGDFWRVTKDKDGKVVKVQDDGDYSNVKFVDEEGNTLDQVHLKGRLTTSGLASMVNNVQSSDEINQVMLDSFLNNKLDGKGWFAVDSRGVYSTYANSAHPGFDRMKANEDERRKEQQKTTPVNQDEIDEAISSGLEKINLPYGYNGQKFDSNKVVLGSSSSMDCIGLVSYMFKIPDNYTAAHIAESPYFFSVGSYNGYNAQPGDVIQMLYNDGKPQAHEMIYLGLDHVLESAAGDVNSVRIHTISAYKQWAKLYNYSITSISCYRKNQYY